MKKLIKKSILTVLAAGYITLMAWVVNKMYEVGFIKAVIGVVAVVSVAVALMELVNWCLKDDNKYW